MSYKLKIIGRVTKEHYMAVDESIVEKTKFKVLKSRSTGSIHDLVTDPETNIECLDLSKYQAGVYQMVTVEEGYDWETGMVDSYELALVKIED